jgi:plastocyanin
MHRSLSRRPLRLTVAAALLAAPLLAACGDDDSTDGATDGTTTTSPSGGASSSLTVHATDQLKFEPDAYETEAGTVDVTYVNDGTVPHTLLIKGVGDFKLSVGTEDEGSVELEPGDYTLYCDVAGHEAAGMVADLTVSS